MTTTTLRRAGGSAITTVPSFISNFLKLEIGDELTWEVEDGKVILKALKTVRKKTKLDDLLDKFEASKTSRTLEDEQWLNSAPQGKELL
ncbi:AbrB/MazE/SpoVT family DNA-binding domain-containing protein [uncultured Turicimonas sp.]|mgnify:FL=1|uniref:AbrB/MazE/SpoVT family DNA-binding domain-containing protein n=1 Tax=uncultured Turicimonas sp. TaxID=1918607 RepID=UPI002805AA9B|nr:hypothetical protein [uncultured Turicimonas sp.]